MNENVQPQDRLRDALTATRGNIADVGHLAKEAVQDKFHEMKDKASEKLVEGKEKLQEYEENIARHVREAPMKSVLIAAGVGLALGWLWRRS